MDAVAFDNVSLTDTAICVHPGCDENTFSLYGEKNKFCNKHICMFVMTGINKICGDYAIDGNRSCKKHACHVQGCTHPMRIGGSYCILHTCEYGYDSEIPTHWHCTVQKNANCGSCVAHRCIAKKDDGSRCLNVQKWRKPYCYNHHGGNCSFD